MVSFLREEHRCGWTSGSQAAPLRWNQSKRAEEQTSGCRTVTRLFCKIFHIPFMPFDLSEKFIMNLFKEHLKHCAPLGASHNVLAVTVKYTVCYAEFVGLKIKIILMMSPKSLWTSVASIKNTKCNSLIFLQKITTSISIYYNLLNKGDFFVS